MKWYVFEGDVYFLVIQNRVKIQSIDYQTNYFSWEHLDLHRYSAQSRFSSGVWDDKDLPLVLWTEFTLDPTPELG